MKQNGLDRPGKSKKITKKITKKGEGAVTRVSSYEGQYINVRIITNDHKLIVDAKFTLKEWAMASTSLVSPCIVDIYGVVE